MLLLAVGIAVAGCDATLDRGISSNAQAAEIQVLVAARDLPQGTLLKHEHLRWQPWPDGSVPDNYLVQGMVRQDSLHGSALRRGIAAGRPIVAGRIVKPGEKGFLAAALTPGHRARAIDISAASNIDGLALPGNRVDLVLTHKVKIGRAAQQISETILRNMRILAIDQSPDNRSNQTGIGKTVTFEVTPKQAEILAVASDLGELSISPSSPNIADIARGATYTRDETAIILRGYRNPHMLMEPYRGTPLTDCAGIPIIPVARRPEQSYLRSPCGNIIPLAPDILVD